VSLALLCFDLIVSVAELNLKMEGIKYKHMLLTQQGPQRNQLLLLQITRHGDEVDAVAVAFGVGQVVAEVRAVQRHALPVGEAPHGVPVHLLRASQNHTGLRQLTATTHWTALCALEQTAYCCGWLILNTNNTIPRTKPRALTLTLSLNDGQPCALDSSAMTCDGSERLRQEGQAVGQQRYLTSPHTNIAQ